MPRPIYKYNLEICFPVKLLLFTRVYYSLVLPPFSLFRAQALQSKACFLGPVSARMAAERTGFHTSVA